MGNFKCVNYIEHEAVEKHWVSRKFVRVFPPEQISWPIQYEEDLVTARKTGYQTIKKKYPFLQHFKTAFKRKYFSNVASNLILIYIRGKQKGNS